MSNSSRPQGLQLARLLRPRDSPGKKTGVGRHCLLLGIPRCPTGISVSWPPSFPLGAFPMWISFLPSPQLSPQSQQQFLAWYCSPIPTLHLPATMHSRGLASLCGVQRAVVRIICVVLTTFRLSQISCFTLRQPQMLPFCPKQLPWIWGSHPCFIEGTQGFLPQWEKDLESPSSTRLEALVPSRDSRARTRSPSPRAWRPDFPGAAREAP